jgi:hypothetical protein
VGSNPTVTATKKTLLGEGLFALTVLRIER